MRERSMKLSHIPKIKMAATMYNLLHYCSLPRCIITLNTERDCYAICYYFESHFFTTVAHILGELVHIQAERMWNS